MPELDRPISNVCPLLNQVDYVAARFLVLSGIAHTLARKQVLVLLIIIEIDCPFPPPNMRWPEWAKVTTLPAVHESQFGKIAETRECGQIEV